MARTITFQRSLFRNLTLTVVLLGVLFVGTETLNIRRSAERIATELTGRALADTRTTVARFLEPVFSLVELSARYFRVVEIGVDETGRLDRYFMPTLVATEQVSGVSLALEDGRSYTLERTADGWERRLSDPAGNPGRSLVSRWKGRGSEPVEEWQDLGFDARTRPWYRAAIENAPSVDRARMSPRETIHLTRPYEFESPDREWGVTAFTSFRFPDGSLGVISFDLLLRDLTEFTAQLGREQSGNVAVLYRDVEDEEDLIAGLSAGLAKAQQETIANYLIAPPRGASDPLLDFVADMLAEEPVDRLRPRKFRSGDRDWWGAATAYDDEILILAIFPESELLGELDRLLLSAVGLTLLFLCLVVWRSSRLSRIYASPIEELASQTERMAGLNFHETAEIETRIEEIQLLAKAQEQLRRSLEAVTSRREDLLIAQWMRGEAKLGSAGVPLGYELGLLDQGMKEVGGSAFDTATHPDSPTLFSLLLGAVPGEGVATAYEAGRLRSVFRTVVRLGASLAERTQLIRGHFEAKPELLASLVVSVAELDVSEATLAVLAEPDCPIVHFAAATGRFRWVDSGPAPEQIALARGDVALMLTASVVRALSPARTCFGREGLEKVVREHAREDAETLARSIGSALDEYTGGVAPERDRTILVLRRSAAPSG